MPGIGWILLVNLMVAEPDVLLRAPRLARGDELTYQGEIREVGEQIQNRFRKNHDLELRLFVLEAHPTHVDCALMTKIRPKRDPAVAGTAQALIGGEVLQPSAAAVRLDLIRLSDQGRVQLLLAGCETLPLNLRQGQLRPLPALPIEAPPQVETGLFLPLPGKPIRTGTSWPTAETNRPPRHWTVKQRTVWNGGQCLELEVKQQSEGWEQRRGLQTGWRRQEQILVSLGDGFVHKVHRKIERHEGANVVGWVELEYEAQPITRRLGSRYDDVRREIELAYVLLDQLRTILQQKRRPTDGEHRLVLSRLERFEEVQPVPGPFREALDSVRRQWSAAMRGELVQLPEAVPDEATAPFPQVEEIAPDFTAPLIGKLDTMHLAKSRGKPTILHFFRAKAETAKDSLQVAEACQSYFGDRVTVVSLALHDATETTQNLQKRLQLQHTLADGQQMRPQWTVPAWPMFLLLNSDGVLHWQFTGQGPETGYLLKQEIDRLLQTPSPRNR